MVDEDTGEVVTDGTGQEGGADTGVDTAAKTKNHTVAAKLGFELLHGGLDERSRAPLLSTATDVYHKVLEQLRPLHGMKNLGVELYGPKRLRGAGIGSKTHIGRRGNRPTVGGNSCNGISVAHPHLRVRFETAEERIVQINVLQVGPTIFAGAGRFYSSATLVGDELCAVTDA